MVSRYQDGSTAFLHQRAAAPHGSWGGNITTQPQIRETRAQQAASQLHPSRERWSTWEAEGQSATTTIITIILILITITIIIFIIPTAEEMPHKRRPHGHGHHKKPKEV
ncbi:unnamed protein product [Merluccius merluccius]